MKVEPDMNTESIRTSDGCDIVFDVLPNSEASQSFVLVHGLASNARLWDPLATELNRRGFSVATLDQRGHGRSSKASQGYDFTTITADLAQVVEFLGQTYRFIKPIVVGQSWGAAVVESFAFNYPDLASGIVAVDGGFSPLKDTFVKWEECEKVLAPPSLLGIPFENFESMVRSRHSDWPESGINGVLANMEKLSDGTFRPWLSRENHMKILWHLWQHNPYEICAQIKVPILFVPAGGDPIRDEQKRRGLKQLSEITKVSKTRWFDPASHDLHAQFPERFANLLQDELENGIFK